MGWKYVKRKIWKATGGGVHGRYCRNVLKIGKCAADMVAELERLVQCNSTHFTE